MLPLFFTENFFLIFKKTIYKISKHHFILNFIANPFQKTVNERIFIKGMEWIFHFKEDETLN